MFFAGMRVDEKMREQTPEEGGEDNDGRLLVRPHMDTCFLSLSSTLCLMKGCSRIPDLAHVCPLFLLLSCTSKLFGHAENCRSLSLHFTRGSYHTSTIVLTFTCNVSIRCTLDDGASHAISCAPLEDWEQEIRVSH